MSQILNISKSKKLDLDIDAWRLTSNKHIEIITVELSSYEKIEPHKNEVDVIFYILEGEGELTLVNKGFKLFEHEMIHVEKNTERAWMNPNTEPLRMLIIKLLES